jgi:putative ABC transport system permease protein
MQWSVFLRLAVSSIYNRRITAVLTALSIAFSVTLFLGVEKIRSGAQTGFSNTVSGTDLIVGARSGSLNLLLYSVFRIGDATNNVSWATYKEIEARRDVEWAVPISLGDSHKGFRVMGTNVAYFEHYKTGKKMPLHFLEGRAFDGLFEVVIGADIARELGYQVGQQVVVSHGIGSVSFANHDNLPFEVVGILSRTGTPVDRTLHVSLESIEAIHEGWQQGAAPRAGAQLSAAELDLLSLQPQAVTAILLGLTSPIAVLKAQRDLNGFAAEPLTAIIPGVALAQLWRVVGVVETALTAIAVFVVLTGLLGLMTNILTGLNERRREMAILRSIGVRVGHIFLLLLAEAGLLAGAGALMALLFVQAVLWSASSLIVELTGVDVGGAGITLFDIATVLIVVAVALILSMFPAWRAYQQSLSDGLTVRV